MREHTSDKIIGTILLFIVVGFFAGIIAGAFWAWPQFNVYSQRMAGQAEFQRAESNRRIRVQEAQALFDAAKLTAQAEVERARGVAEANEIIADSLGGAEGYLRWRYIEMLEETGRNNRDVIYIPTEAALPILEAGRFNQD